MSCDLQVPIPDDMKATVSARRAELVERVAEVDETVGELFLMEEPIDNETLHGGIRRATLALKFVPVFMGRSAIQHQSKDDHEIWSILTITQYLLESLQKIHFC